VNKSLQEHDQGSLRFVSSFFKESKKAPGKGKGTGKGKEMPGKQEKDENEAITLRWAQLGPHPFWLVGEMKDSFLKDELGKASSCMHLNSELIS